MYALQRPIETWNDPQIVFNGRLYIKPHVFGSVVCNALWLMIFQLITACSVVVTAAGIAVPPAAAQPHWLGADNLWSYLSSSAASSMCCFRCSRRSATSLSPFRRSGGVIPRSMFGSIVWTTCLVYSLINVISCSKNNKPPHVIVLQHPYFC